ncbi:GTP-binding protein SAR1-like [Mytilus californianus]|uniref:GTP-binding protein SAR1-like n=1 Tax=Mytilus californianus TaxID=6549 RepID=UPI0022485AA8|nr:GTP-binding protein SAR1-like [Mytilus californianus]
MFLFDWFRSILQYFGFINTKCNLLILGLHDAGKSTLLSRLKDGRLVQHTPTNHPWSEEFTVGKVTFEVYDLGGHILALSFWRRYIPAVKGIVFIVDASDSQSLPEARQELTSILTDEDVSDVPVLVLGNKIDKRGCYGKEQLIKELGIDQHLSNSVNTEDKSGIRPCTLVMSSLLHQTGYGDGLKWMATQIHEEDRINNNSTTVTVTSS